MVPRERVLMAPRHCAVLGSPIRHSLSPTLHRAAYAHLGLDWTYDAHEVDEAGLRPFVDELDASWRGLSLTRPLKRAALAVADRVSPLAREVGAANTLLLEDDGSRTADNTDVPGMVAAIRTQAGPLLISACVWGGGATAASALAALRALRVERAHLHTRRSGGAAATLEIAATLGLRVTAEPWQPDEQCATADLLISTTPAGATDNVADALAGSVRPNQLLFDVVYDPWPTKLARAWANEGGAVTSGLDLLVHQAIGQVRLMTGRDVPAEVLYAAVS
jgi:shikimate dehydrogenase